MTPQQFITKWSDSELSEKSGSHEHFLDVCRLVNHGTPAGLDKTGESFTFERGVEKTGGKNGWADVWKRGFFGWEYKGTNKDLQQHKTLDDAYRQLQLYRASLENPPLLVVCDMRRFVVYTNFTNTVEKKYEFDTQGLADEKNLTILRSVFHDPEALRPGQTRESITQQAAEQFGQLADRLWQRGVPAQRAAHFLMKLMFCMFADDIGLLPNKTFTELLDRCKSTPAKFVSRLKELFEAMRTGGEFGYDAIQRFNGGLFNDADVIEELRPDEIAMLVRVNEYEWSDVEPSVFGTLFERTLDPEKRAQIGAHYTSREDILTIVEPVVMTPLRRRWQEVQTECEAIWAKLKSGTGAKVTKATRRKQLDRKLQDFVEELSHIRILDPACGSGNFLYVAINLLLDLEKEVVAYASSRGLGLFPQVRPTQLAGIEINPYAKELASVVIWIGYLQWMHHNGFNRPRNPVLEPIESICRMDAILDLSDPENPREPEWPEAEFIVGNPPFLGYSKIRSSLGSEYTDAMFRWYDGRVSNQSDLCCYWFEKALGAIRNKTCKRVGLLATQGIRGGKNRLVLEAIKSEGDIFFAESDRDWILDGANVHVSMIGFDDGTSPHRILDGKPVPAINSNLTSDADTTRAIKLSGNSGKAFVGGFKFGSFDIADATAIELLASPSPNGKPASDVVRPWMNGLDVLRRDRQMWIIDFGIDTPIENASLYAEPFSVVVQFVKPERDVMRRQRRKERWWLHGESAHGLRRAVNEMPRFLVTPRVAKYRVFFWVDSCTVIDGQLVAIATEDDYMLGVLHSRPHQVWGLKMGTRLETRPRYTPTTCFETFPFPDSTDAQRFTISQVAVELDRLRNNWLNPPEWTRTEILEFPGSADGPWKRYIDPETVDERGIGTVRYSRLVPKDEEYAKELKKRTLTNLYNKRETWLDLAHRRLDEAVFAAYGWDPSMTDDELLAALLALNLERAAGEAATA